MTKIYIISSFFYMKLKHAKILIFGPRREKSCLRAFANKKGAHQTTHPRSLISAFVIDSFFGKYDI